MNNDEIQTDHSLEMSLTAIVTDGGALGGSEGVQSRLVVLLSTAKVPFFFLYVVAAADDMAAREGKKKKLLKCSPLGRMKQ